MTTARSHTAEATKLPRWVVWHDDGFEIIHAATRDHAHAAAVSHGLCPTRIDAMAPQGCAASAAAATETPGPTRLDVAAHN